MPEYSVVVAGCNDSVIGCPHDFAIMSARSLPLYEEYQHVNQHESVPHPYE
jgi:hypothetical protein